MRIESLTFTQIEIAALRHLVSALPSENYDDWGITPADVKRLDKVRALPADKPVALADNNATMKTLFRLVASVGDSDGSMTRIGVQPDQTDILLGLHANLEPIAEAAGWDMAA